MVRLEVDRHLAGVESVDDVQPEQGPGPVQPFLVQFRDDFEQLLAVARRRQVLLAHVVPHVDAGHGTPVGTSERRKHRDAVEWRGRLGRTKGAHDPLRGRPARAARGRVEQHHDAHVGRSLVPVDAEEDEVQQRNWAGHRH
jgi:hypothetical protein